MTHWYMNTSGHFPAVFLAKKTHTFVERLGQSAAENFFLYIFFFFFFLLIPAVNVSNNSR